MQASVLRVLGELRRLKRGISVENFPRGFRLGARIFDLRQLGFEIETIRDDPSGGRLARYVLLKEKRGTA